MPESMTSQARTSLKAESSGSVYLGMRVHLIGAGGVGMRALGQVLMLRGAVLSGSDSEPSEALDDLAAAGAEVSVGQCAENLPDECDLVVYSAAIDQSNPELLAARQFGCEVIKYSRMLGRLMSDREGIAIAGTHGKSTTTAMVAYALAAAGKKPSFIVGATSRQLGGPSGIGDGRHFVVEACEFDRSFLNLSPTFAAILNIEEDHLDCFENLDAIIEAFGAFAAKVPTCGVLVANGDDRSVAAAVREASCKVQTFGLTEGCYWRGVNLTSDRGLFRFDVLVGGSKFGRIALRIPGRHNVFNALAAAALLHHAGLSADEIARAVAEFEGVHRRMTVKAQLGGITVADDYAHHPTEIQVTLRAAKDFFNPSRIRCVFQPHQHSRTRFLLEDFARSFGQADEIILPDIYFVRDSEREKERISAHDLVAEIRLKGGDAVCLPEFDLIIDYLKRSLVPGDLVITMGAGDVWKIADEIVRWLETDS